jgi:hypothetical protein
MMDEKKTVALILAQLEPRDGVTIGIGPTDEVELTPEEQLQAVAGELIEGVKACDPAAVAEALRAAFLLCDSMPHVEGEHTEETPEEEEPEEYGHEMETVSHEVRERLGGYEEPEGYSYGGKARKRYAKGGRVGYAYGGTAAPGPGWLQQLTTTASAPATMQSRLAEALAKR